MWSKVQSIYYRNTIDELCNTIITIINICKRQLINYVWNNGKIKSYFPLNIKIINYRDYQNYAKWCKSEFDKLCKNTQIETNNNNLSHFNNSINTDKLLINLHKHKNVITCMWDWALMQQCITTPDDKPWADNNGMDLFKIIIKIHTICPYTISYNIQWWKCSFQEQLRKFTQSLEIH